MKDVLNLLSDMEWELKKIIEMADDLSPLSLKVLLDAAARIHMVCLALQRGDAKTDKSWALIGGGLEDCVIR